MDQATVWLRRTLQTTSCDWHRLGTLRATLCDWHKSGNTGATLCSWHRSDNTASDTMQLTWIGQQFGWDALCEQHHAADIDRATLRATLCGWHRSDNTASDTMRLTWWTTLRATLCGWHRSDSGLCEWHYAADIDRTTLAETDTMWLT